MSAYFELTFTRRTVVWSQQTRFGVQEMHESLLDIVMGSHALSNIILSILRSVHTYTFIERDQSLIFQTHQDHSNPGLQLVRHLW